MDDSSDEFCQGWQWQLTSEKVFLVQYTSHLCISSPRLCLQLIKSVVHKWVYSLQFSFSEAICLLPSLLVMRDPLFNDASCDMRNLEMTMVVSVRICSMVLIQPGTPVTLCYVRIRPDPDVPREDENTSPAGSYRLPTPERVPEERVREQRRQETAGAEPEDPSVPKNLREIRGRNK